MREKEEIPDNGNEECQNYGDEISFSEVPHFLSCDNDSTASITVLELHARYPAKWMGVTLCGWNLFCVLADVPALPCVCGNGVYGGK